jgi:hemoglobin
MPDLPLYDLVGGDTTVRALVTRFYDEMDTVSDVSELRALHPPNLAGSREKLYWFLTGWLGGPQLYVERKGHPRLRARHLPVAIGVRERDQWMRCMDRALAETIPDRESRAFLSDALGRLATHMINREDLPGDAEPSTR